MTRSTFGEKSASISSNMRPISLGWGRSEISISDTIGISTVDFIIPTTPDDKPCLSPSEQRKVMARLLPGAINHVKGKTVVFPISKSTAFVCGPGVMSMPETDHGILRLRVEFATEMTCTDLALSEDDSAWHGYARSLADGKSHSMTIIGYDTLNGSSSPSIKSIEGIGETYGISVSVTVRTEKMTWGELVNRQYSASDTNASSRAKQTIDTMLDAAYNPQNRWIREGHEYYPRHSNALDHPQLQIFYGMRGNGQGLKYQQGISRRLHIIDERLMLVEKSCGRLFFAPGRVSDFMIAFVGEASVSVTSPANMAAAVRSALKGIRVILETEPGKPRRVITGVAAGDASQTQSAIPGLTVAEACAKRGQLALSTTLPCINVGTESRPKYVAPEHCRIPEDLPFTGELTRSQDQWLSACSSVLLNANSIETGVKTFDKFKCDPPVCFQVCPELPDVASTPVFASPSDPRDRSLTSLSDGCQDLLKFLFVEVGKSPSQSVLWTDFMYLLNSKVSAHEVGHTVRQPIRIKPLSSGVSSNTWKHLLSTSAVSRYERQRVVLVFGFGEDENSKEIERRVKRVCDIELGVQSIFIPLSDLQAPHRTRKTFGPSVDRFADDTLARLLSCNPRSGATSDLIVGLHVIQLSKPATAELRKPGTRAANGWSTVDKWYLIALSARAAESSQNYHSAVSVHKVLEGGSVDLSPILSDFICECTQQAGLDLLEGFDRVTVYRSGSVLPVDQTVLTDGSPLQKTGKAPRSESPECGESALETLKAAPTRTAAMDVDLTIEAELFAHVLQATSTRLSYFHVTESPTCNFDQDIRETIYNAFTQEVRGSSGWEMDRKGAFFTCNDDGFRPGTVVEVHRKMHRKDGTPDHRVRKAVRLTVIKHDQPKQADVVLPGFKRDGRAARIADAWSSRVWPRPIGDDTPETPPSTRQSQSINEDLAGRSVSGVAESLVGLDSIPAPMRSWYGRENNFSKNPLVKQDMSIAGRSLSCGNNSTTAASQPRSFSRQSWSSALDDLKSLQIDENLSPQASSSKTIMDKRASVPVAVDQRGNQAPAIPTKRDLSFLRAIHPAFHDWALDLHDTTWPIPSYLAQKAAKRAILHMETDCWDEEGLQSSPFKLLQVKKSQSLNGTLHFLM